jgi:hypothetical protein
MYLRMRHKGKYGEKAESPRKSRIKYSLTEPIDDSTLQ